MKVCAGRSRFSQSPNTFFAIDERFLGGDVADDGEDRVVRREMAGVERQQIVARDARQRGRRAVLRQPVRMEAVDQAIEHRIGNVARIFGADLEPREHLLPLPFDLGRREAGCRAMSDSIRMPGLEAVLHHHHVAEA